MINIQEEIQKLQVKFNSIMEHQKKVKEFLGETSVPIIQCNLQEVPLNLPSIKQLLVYIHPDKIHLHPFSDEDKSKILNLTGRIIGENLNIIQGLQILEKEISHESFEYLCQKLSITWNINCLNPLDVYFDLRKMIELSEQNINMLIETKVIKIYFDVRDVVSKKHLHLGENKKIKDLENYQEIPIFIQIKENFPYLEDYFVEKSFDFFTYENSNEVKNYCIFEINKRIL